MNKVDCGLGCFAQFSGPWLLRTVFVLMLASDAGMGKKIIQLHLQNQDKILFLRLGSPMAQRTHNIFDTKSQFSWSISTRDPGLESHLQYLEDHHIQSLGSDYTISLSSHHEAR